MSTKYLPRALSLIWLVGTMAWMPIGVFELGKVAGIALDRSGRPGDTDFLNLYTGAWLLVHAPSQVYTPEAQHALEQTLAGQGHAYLGFFLPPSSALALGWLGLLPFGVAYVVWLVVALGCVGAAGWLLGGLDSRLSGRPAWVLGLLLFLPIVEGLGQGQTSALMLLGVAAWARGLLQGNTRWLWLAVLAFGLKPQFVVAPLIALGLARRRGTLLRFGAAVCGLIAGSLLMAGPELLTSYRLLSGSKFVESLTAPPDFLPGPTVLHAMQRLFGTGVVSDALGLGLDGLLLCALAWVWRGGLLADERRLLQVALVPLVAVLAAPYALVHELSCWPVAFCLLERYTRPRPLARVLVLLLGMGVWVTGALGVLDPNPSRGADLAALLGLAAVAFIIRDWALMPDGLGQRPALPTISGCRSTSSATTF